MTMTQASLNDAVSLFQVNSTTYVSVKKLKELLRTPEMAVFFGKVYDLDYRRLSDLLSQLFQTTVVATLTEGNHSTELQDYLVDTIPSYLKPEPDSIPDPDDAPLPQSELLTALVQSATIQVANSIKEVGAKLSSVIHLLPSKQGSMVFQSMMKMNRNRPTVGAYQANIKHQRVPNSLVILDVSGSMSESTVRAVLADVLSLTYDTNAHLATVSNQAHHWEPGGASMKDVLDNAAYGGTHYEMLAPLMNRDWHTVVTIADYDSSPAAGRALARCTGRIGTVFDISLVNRPSYLAECVGQLADDVQPLLVGRNAYL